MNINHLYELKKLKKTIFSDLKSILDQKCILKVKDTKCVRNGKNSGIFENSKVDHDENFVFYSSPKRKTKTKERQKTTKGGRFFFANKTH